MTTPVMTITDLSAYLHTSVATLYRLIHNNKIPYYRIGASGHGDYRFNVESIDRWRHEQEKKSHG